MKIFIYKTLIVFFLFIVAFHLTFNLKLRQYEKQLKSMTDKQNIEKIKTKVKDEMNSAIKKENYLTLEERNLINSFIQKIKEELSKTQ
tara:strand:+ start:2686 stop:2949 length:264 start_codon:yes stop_codon:yes gene_type:complete